MKTKFKSIISIPIFFIASVLPTTVFGGSTPCLADLNNDQIVDGQDLTIFSEHYGRTDCSIATSCHGDISPPGDSGGPDGDSDGRDLALLIKDFGRTDCAAELTITITTPVDGAQIDRPHVLVQGTISNPDGYETGITVNGQAALVHGIQFAANHIPLHNGPNTLEAVVTTPNGPTASESITVTADTTAEYLRLRAHPETGTAPLNVKLTLEPTLPFTDAVITHVEPGATTLIENNKTEYLARLDTLGITVFTAEFIDFELNHYTDKVAVVVLDTAELDALLSAKWIGMKTALFNSNVEAAVSYFNGSSRDDYREIFTALHPQLPDIASSMQEIVLIYIDDKTAKYRIKRSEVAQGQVVDISYFIYFIKDYRGLWYIDRF